MSKKLNRRDFIVSTAAAAGAAANLHGQPSGSIPRRTLGQTGDSVSILAFGGGSRFLMYEDEEEALRILNEAIDSGINYLDTAVTYGNGRSESRYGRIFPSRRREVFLATKLSDRDYDSAMRSLEGSLSRLNTDHVDLLHIHSLEGMDDLARIEAPNGVLKALYRARDEKMTRFIGMTSHTDAATLRTAIERHDLNCCQMALNAATNTGYSTGFERIALPAAREKKLGVLAMKIAGQDQLVGTGVGRAKMRELLQYSMSLQVAACVVGMPRPEHLRENIETARSFAPLTDPEMEGVRRKVEATAAALDRFFRNHKDHHC